MVGTDQHCELALAVSRKHGKHEIAKEVIVWVVVLVEYIAELSDETGLDVVELVGFLADVAGVEDMDGPAPQDAARGSCARNAGWPVELVLGVHPVVAENVAVALDQNEDEAGLGWCVPVGGDPVAGSVRVVNVAPRQLSPLFGAVGVGRDEPKLAGVDPRRVAEGVAVDDEQEVVESP